MAFIPDEQKQDYIIRQSCLNRVTDLIVCGAIPFKELSKEKKKEVIVGYHEFLVKLIKNKNQ